MLLVSEVDAPLDSSHIAATLIDCLVEMIYLLVVWVGLLQISVGFHLSRNNIAAHSIQRSTVDILALKTAIADTASNENIGKTLTKEIMSHFGDPRSIDAKKELLFKTRLFSAEEKGQLDAMHMITLLFQSARSRRKVKSLMPVELILKCLNAGSKQWSERDVSSFVYGIRSLGTPRLTLLTLPYPT